MTLGVLRALLDCGPSTGLGKVQDSLPSYIPRVIYVHVYVKNTDFYPSISMKERRDRERRASILVQQMRR